MSRSAELANKIEIHLKLDETPGYYLSKEDQETIVRCLRLASKHEDSAMSLPTTEEPTRRAKLLANLRALADGPGHTATIISIAADELEMAWQQLSVLAPEDGSVAALKSRADGDAESCKEMLERMRAIRDLAEAAIKMEWLFASSMPTAFDAVMAQKRRERS